MKTHSAKVIGQGGNSLELTLCPNGDFLISVESFDTNKGQIQATAQFPNLINSGGDLNAYTKIKEVYELLASK